MKSLFRFLHQLTCDHRPIEYHDTQWITYKRCLKCGRKFRIVKVQYGE